MKKLLSIILTLSFILCASATFAASAAETRLDSSEVETGWYQGSGRNFLFCDPDRGLAFYAKTDAYSKVYDYWLAHREGSLTEGTITAVLGAGGNVGIFFGGSGLSTTEENSYWNTGEKYYSWIAYDVDPATKDATLRFYYDNTTEKINNAAGFLVKEVPLDKTTYGIDDTSDVTLEVEFTQAGKVVASINGVVALDEEGYPTTGGQHGLIPSFVEYPEKGEVCYVKSFTVVNPAPDTGDNTAIYVVASAVILAATFAVVCFSRKKRIAE